MSAVEYLPGDRWLISGPTAAVHLAGETAAALRWWPRIRDGVTTRELVKLLQQDGVLFSSEPFAMIALEGDAVRVIVGGDTVVLVEDTAGHQVSISGADLLTWSERVVPDAAVVYVNCTTLPAAGDLLPMPAGVVRADVVRWAVGSDRPARALADGQHSDLASGDALDDDVLSGDVLSVELPGGTFEDVAVRDDIVRDHIVPEDDVVGDDAITLIGVVPGAAARQDAAEPADVALPEYDVPGQDLRDGPASDAVGPDEVEELEQTVITDPVVAETEADPEAESDPETEAESDPETEAESDPDPGVESDVDVDVEGEGEGEDVHSEGSAPESDAESRSEVADELPEATQLESPDAADADEGDAAAVLDDPHPLEETISHADDGQDAEVERDPVAAELPGEVTQTVPPEDLGDHDDTGGEDGQSDSDDSGAAADGSEAVAGNDGGEDGDSLPANPFPRMSLPAFVPPSAPGFITSATPGAPTRAPFAPPPYPSPVQPGQDGGPVGASTIHDVPRPSGPPPFVPASTTLPPISVVPGQAPAGSAPPAAPPAVADPDAVATGVPPLPLPGEAASNGSAGTLLGADGVSSPASPDHRAESRAGDHDGHTVLSESLPEDHRPPAMPPEPAPGQVYASVCPAGHPNAPYAGDCRVCGAPIPATEPVLVQKPTMAVLRMSSGAVIELDRRVIVGRAPSVSRVASADVPHLVTVASPHGDVSRSHVEVQVDDWHIVVTDLNSTNGTEIHAPGRPVQLLRAGVSVVVEIGWQIDLGDGAGFLVDHL